MGLAVEFHEGHGPVLPSPVRTRQDIDRLAIPDPDDTLPFVPEAVRAIRAALGGRVPLIGFAGAPFTLACYAVEGSGSKNWSETKRLLFGAPDAAHALLDKLARATALYLESQVRAGAEALQLFDSWAGILAPAEFREFALGYAARVIETLRGSPTWRDGGVPIIYFVNGCAPYIDDLADSGADVLGIDWRVDLAEVRRRVGGRAAVQGNLDPTALFASPEVIRRQVQVVLDAAGGGPGHVFNLGHGVLPETDPDRVRVMVEAVKELSRRR
jgi:uroporphyrinogen decarboxylase